MKMLNLIAVITLSTLLSCDKIPHHGTCGPDPSGSVCVEQKLEHFRQDDETCSDATIKSYMFQGQLVYVMDYGSCFADMTSEVLGDNCKTLGYLGGFAGNSQINGVDFWSNATFVALVWHK